MENHIRMKLEITKKTEMLKFMLAMNSEADRYMIENFNGSYHVSAQSVLGVIEAVVDWSGEIYLVNETNDGVFSPALQAFRAA